MYEVWVSQQNPSIHLVKRPETPLPSSGGRLEWSLLGLSRVEAEVARRVDSDGMAEVVSVVPFDPNGVFGPEEPPSGLQNDPR